MTSLLNGIMSVDQLVAKLDQENGFEVLVKTYEDQVSGYYKDKDEDKDKDKDKDKEKRLSGCFGDVPEVLTIVPKVLPLIWTELGFKDGIVIGGRVLSHLCVGDRIKSPETFDIYFYDADVCSQFDETYRKCIDVVKESKNKIVGSLKVGDSVYQVVVYKRIYGSINEILFSIQKYINRICVDKSKFVGSMMFFVELHRLNKGPCIDVGSIDDRVREYGNVHRIVNAVDSDLSELKKIVDDGVDYEILDRDGYTPLERAIYLYLSSDDPLLRKNLRNIMMVLAKCEYRRLPQLLFHAISSVGPIGHDDIYEVFEDTKCKYGFVKMGLGSGLGLDTGRYSSYRNDSTVLQINTQMVLLLVGHGQKNISDTSCILDFLDYIDYRFDLSILSAEPSMKNDRELLGKIISGVYKRNPSYGIVTIIRTELIDIFAKLVDFKRIPDNVIRYIVPEVIENGLQLSLLYLIKSGYDVFNREYDVPILHYLTGSRNDHMNDKIMGILKIIRKYSSYGFAELINIRDKEGNTLLHKLVSCRSALARTIILDPDFKVNKVNIDVSARNNDGDTLLHILVRGRDYNVVKSFVSITEIRAIIDIQNCAGETALILAARGRDEKICMLLIGAGANDGAKDQYNNTVYHYICMNEMMLGSTIVETENDYGYKPSDYTNLKKYYDIRV